MNGSSAGLVPGRRLHVIDIENLSRLPLPRNGQINRVKNLYAMQPGFGKMDLVVIACSHMSLVTVGTAWPDARLLARSGPNGADLALCDVLAQEDVARRFGSVVIGSGDHMFAKSAVRLAESNVWVTVVGWRRHIAKRLIAAAAEVVFLDDNLDKAA
jgi:hypothetical protein